mgnify:CR=1 FL=1
MATFLDIIAQLKFDVQGNEELGDFAGDLDKAEKEAGRLEAKMKALKNAINQTSEAAKRNVLTNELRKTEMQVKRLQSEFKKTGSTFSDFKDGILQVFGGTLLAGGITGLVTGLGAIGKQAFDTSVRLQALRTSLAAATGGVAEGEQAFEFLVNTSRNLGLDLESSAQGFKQISAAARPAGFDLANTEKIFTQISTATRALNLSSEDTQGIFLAFSQVLSKGKVQAEELRGQIGERLPGAFQIAAKAVGLTTAELSKQLELGNVYSNDFLPKFAAALENEYKDKLEAATQTTSAQLSKIRTEWTLLFENLGKSSGGFVNFFIKGINLTLSKLNEFFESTNRLGEVRDILGKFGAKENPLGFAGFQDEQAVQKFLGSIDATAAKYTNVADQLTAVNKAILEVKKSSEFANLSQEAQSATVQLLQKRFSELAVAIQDESKLEEEAALLARQKAIKAAEDYAKKLRDVTDAINDAITRQREYIEQAKVADGKESEATIRARIAAQQEKELNAVEKLRREAAQKLGKNDPTVTALLKTLSGVIKDRFSLEAENEVNKFLEKQKELIAKFNNEIKDLQAKAEIDRRKLLSGTSAEADIAILEAEFAQRKQAREKEQAERVKDATELNQDVKQVNDLYREQELIAEAEFAAAKNDINEKYLKKAIDDLANFSDIRISETDQAESEALTALNNAYTKGLIDKTQYEAQKTAIQKEFQKQRINAQKAEIEIQILALETTKEQTDEVKRKIAALKSDLAKLNQELSEPADDTAKQRREKLVSETIDYAGQSLEIIKSINALIIANETEKYDKLISLQQERVERANRIADEGNAEALQREEARLRQLTEARERAAARQRRIAAVLNAANIALAATESIVAITRSAAQGGVAAPVTVPITLAAIAAGIGIITSLIGGFSNQTAQGFEEGTPFVKGKKERSTAKDNIPAWLTEGERVVTVNNNRKYYDIYEYIEKNKPNPELLKQRLAGNVVIDYNALQSQHINAKGYELQAAVKSVISEQLSNALTAINGNMELLVNETHKARKSGTDINNVSALAKAVAAELQRENLRWKL